MCTHMRIYYTIYIEVTLIDDVLVFIYHSDVYACVQVVSMTEPIFMYGN